MNGSEIKKLRTNAGLSQSQVAMIVGASTSTVCRWEKGKTVVPGGTLAKLRTWVRTHKDKDKAKPEQAKPEPVESVPAKPEPAPEAKPRLRSGHPGVEAALLDATARITAAWVASHGGNVQQADVVRFVRQITRAIREET